MRARSGFGFVGAACLLTAALSATPFGKGGVLGVGAAEAGQAGAVVAREAGPQALWWNPAGLALGRDFSLAFDYGSVLGGFRHDNALAQRGRLDELGLGYAWGWRSVGAEVEVAETEYAAGVAFPFSQDERVNIGFALRILEARVAQSRAPGYGIDLGVHYRAPGPLQGLSLGLAVRDFQGALEWPAGPRSDPAQSLQVGAAWVLDAATTLELDSEFVNDPNYSGRGSQGFKLGAERWWGLPAWGLERVAALRLGYLQNSAQAPSSLGGQFSLGLGLIWKGISLDYAYVQDVEGFGPTHRVGLTAAFGGPQPDAASGPRAGLTPSPTSTPIITPTLTPSPRSFSLALRAEPASFWPTRAEVLRLWLEATPEAEASSCLVEIRPEGGTPVFTQTVQGLPRSIDWDGRLPGGGLAQAGAYRAAVAVRDAAGNTLAAAEAGFRIETGAATGRLRLTPDADIFAPIPQSIRKSIGLAVGWDGPRAQAWTLSVRRAGTRMVLRRFGSKGQPRSVRWDGRLADGRRAPDGAYELSLRLRLPGASAISATARVEVDTRRPKLEFEARPTLFDTDTGAVDFRLGLLGQAGIPARWRVQVQTADGRALKTFSGEGVPPEHVVWDVRDDAGRPLVDGSLYYVDARAEMESGAVATQPRLAVASRLVEPQLPFRVPLQTLRFAEGDDGVDLGDYAGLKEVAAAVKKYSSTYAVQVLGYATVGESGRAGLGPLELSFLRAKAVRDYLVESEGLDPARVRAAGLGTEKPLGDAARDRRVEVILYAQ